MKKLQVWDGAKQMVLAGELFRNSNGDATVIWEQQITGLAKLERHSFLF